ncbi:MAG TPA: PAS domain-containing protein [Chitinophagaceae bacterium]|nr:PAS domain-containing protein [Chitinophagaceae bacterium]
MPENIVDFKSVFTSIPGSNVLVLPDHPNFTIVAVSDEYLHVAGRSKEELMGKGLFEAFPNNPDDPNQISEKTVRASLEYVKSHKEAHHLPIQRYDVSNGNGIFEERYWSASTKPILSEDGEVVYLLHNAQDVTEKLKKEQGIKKMEQAYELFMQAPVAICIVKGPTYIVEMANEDMLHFLGRTSAMIGKPIIESLPEAGIQGLIKILDGVRTTGAPYKVSDFPATLLINGAKEVRYFDLVFKPYFQQPLDKEPASIFCVVHNVTQQVAARGKVEESNKELGFVLNAMPQMVWVTLSDGYHYFYNQQWYDYTGLTYGETEGTGWNNVFHPDDQERAWQVWQHSLKTGEPYEIEYRCRRFDGVYRWFLGRALPLKDASGIIIKWYGTCTDIHDQKKAGEILEQSEARSRLAVESARLGTYDIDLVHKTIIHSPRIAEIFGLDITKQWPYKVFTDAVHPDDVPMRQTAHEKAKQTGELLYEVRIVLPNQSIRWIRLNGKYSFAENVPVSIVGTVMDITEERKASELLEQKIAERTAELESQKRLLDNILINSSNGISVTEMIRDEKGNVIDAATILANDAAVSFTGLPKEVYLSKRALELDPNMLTSPYGQTCLQTLQTGEPSISQYFMEMTGRWLELSISKMDDDHLIHIFTDVTPIKQSQLQLERSVEVLKRTNTNLEEFAYAASHDMKEPIRKIHFFSDRLKERLSDKLEPEDVRLFERMQHASKRMGTLIDDLLTYSQATRGIADVEEIDLGKKVQLVLEDLELEVQEKNAQIVVGLLPTIRGNKRQMQQLFQNLISNALKYSKPGIAPKIQITSTETKGGEAKTMIPVVDDKRSYYLIEVKDNGIGFKQEDAERIFNMFTRLHGIGEFKGTGVGLSIVRKVVENHNGYIWAESIPEEGATFKVLLPVT